ncbi:MAG TPA: iron-containing redox enzyme family protein [Allosphingosinicella sp.]|nr:iron-containing redox enzyme family protein [Allosphingosinicella sp.]
MATKARLEAVPSGSPHFFSHGFQAALATWNQERLEPGFPEADWEKILDREHRMKRLEGAFVEALRGEVAEAAAAAPDDADGFIAWFEALAETGPGQGDPLFPWIADTASEPGLCWFLEQEAAGEAGFEDLTAFTQVKMPTRPKLELARNYWDEMGRGNPKGMHGPLLDTLVERLALKPRIESTCWESLALANAMTAMATSRRYAFHSVGALGAIELTAPGRSAATAAGLKRLGFTGRERHYFDLHAVLDVKHSEEWNKEVIRPLVEEDPSRARPMAEGALIRLLCGARCYERYRAQLWS